MARDLAPAILFLEDIDLYGSHRESSSNSSVLGELMNQLDGIVENDFVITIATTNKAEAVEDALRNRPGRFDRVLDIPKPDAESREAMLKVHSKQCDIAGVNFNDIAKKLKDYTGAHVKELVNIAIISAVESNSVNEGGKILLKTEHFLPHIETVRTKTITPVGFGVGNDDDPDEL